MQFLSNPAIFGVLVISFICHFQISDSSYNRKKTSTKTSVTTERNTNIEEIATGLTDIAGQSSSEEGVDILDVGMKVAEVVATLAPSPVGPLLSLGLTLFGMSGGGKEDPYVKIEEALRANDEASRERDSLTQSMILEESKRLEGIIIAESFRVIRNLTETFDMRPFMKTMRQQLEYLESKYSDNIACVLNSHCVGEAKEGALGSMINPFSEYRTILHSFISNFIEPKNRNLQKSYAENLFFDFLLNEAREKEYQNKDCFSESIQTQIFKSYMFIAKILTNAYSIVASAHAVRYREYSVEKNATDKIATKVSESVKIANEYHSHMGILMKITEKSLQEASGEIRKCDPHDFIIGKSFNSLNFRDKNTRCFPRPPTDPPGIYRQNGHYTCQHRYPFQKVGYSTEEVTARPGYVITGIRWEFDNDIIYVNIKEGKFIDGTRVDENTVTPWESQRNDKRVEYFDHITGIILEDVILEPGTYVTGVRLVRFNGGMLTLSVQGSGTNSQGTKLSGKPFWVDPEIKNYSKLSRIRLDDPETNLERSESKVMRDQGRYYLEVPSTAHWNSERYDIPYLDIQEVVTEPPAPISGLGIYHKTVKEYGYFVALKMISPDYSYMLNDKQLETYTKLFQIKPKNKLKTQSSKSSKGAQVMNRKDGYHYTSGVGTHKLHTIGKTFFQAREICISEGGHLAVINSIAEGKVLLNLLTTAGSMQNIANEFEAFIGIYRSFPEGNWLTILGGPLHATGYENWSNGQPDNGAGIYPQNCGAFTKNGTMDDFACDYTLSFFCELPSSSSPH